MPGPPLSRRVIVGFAALLYFSEGLPYGFVTELLPVYMRVQGMSLAKIGLLSTVGLAWTVKLLWAPLVDRLGEFRFWIWGSLLTLTLCFFALSVSSAQNERMFWLLVTLIALASATQDIAVDGLVITVTPNNLLGRINSVRVTAYRVAIILAGGGLTALATRSSWQVGILTAGIVSGILLMISLTIPRIGQASFREGAMGRAFAGWVMRRDAILLLLIVLLYRVGDSSLTPMIKPYWIDRGYSAAEVGTVTTVIGISFTILGAMIGGWGIDRVGVFRALLLYGLVQALSNLGYAAVATFELGRVAIYGASVVENFTGGLGTAAFLAFLMSLCDKQNPATEYALLTAIYGISRSAAGTLSGFATERIGYGPYFWLTFFLGLPALLLILRLVKAKNDANANSLSS